MFDPDSLRIIHLTPSGPGAIATLRAEGPGAHDAVAKQFRARSKKPLCDCPIDRPILGAFGPEPGEPIVVHRRRNGSIEMHCHGGVAAVERIARGLVDAGAQTIGWSDWIRGQHVDPIVADACIAMSQARTERTAAILVDQYNGALSRAIGKVEQLLAAGRKGIARQRVETLLARAGVGQHLTSPWRVVLAGRPNVGKSSLMNAILGYERAIVHTTAGTTRDVVSAATAIDGWPVEVIDTAGLSPAEEGEERGTLVNRGIALAKEQMAAADLLVLVCDRTRPLSDEENTWLDHWPRALRVDNKSDLPVAAGPRPPALETSALQGKGITELLQTITERLVSTPPPVGAAVPFSEAQCSRLLALLDESL